MCLIFCIKQKPAYELRISDWSSDVCSSDLQGPITLVSADAALPCDRPNLSKDYIAGSAPPEWIPLRSADFYADQRIDMRLRTRVTALDPTQKSLTLDDGSQLDYGALLLGTGASPARPPILGADQPHVHGRRTLSDADAQITRPDTANSSEDR